ncbi:MAG: RNA methyltransferase [Alistipes sp.]|nr:RNA methyltransferase [Alistipes sp.]
MTKAEIQFVRSLSDKRVRDAERLFIAEGDKLIGEILQSNLKVRHLYALEGHFDGRAERVSEKEMERISQLKTASTSLAVVEQPRHKATKSAPATALSLALDGVQNPGNLGTIIRLADWFGVEDIFCSEDTADCFNPKVVQATMGAILRVRVHYLPLADFLRHTRESGVEVYGTMLDGQNIYDVELASMGVIVMGNEGRGVSAECAASFSQRLLIPAYSAAGQGSESLNVAMATGIVCAEFRRRMR